MKVVLDSNVLIAAFASHGLCHLVFETVISQHELILSPFILNEVEKALLNKIKIPKAIIKEILVYLKSESEIVKEYPPTNVSCRDKNDLDILALAIKAQVSVLVSGDQDLLEIGSVENLKILSPRQFWELLRSGE